MTKVGVVSLGCPKNLVDSEVMMGLLVEGGYELTPRPEEAQILLVNTCSFIEPAQKESIDTILELAEYKKSGSAEKLIVTGCLVERFRQQILSEIPEVDAVLGVVPVAPDTFKRPPVTVDAALRRFTTSLVPLDEEVAALLDVELLIAGFQAALP